MNVSIDHWWNGNDKENLKYSGSNLSQCHFMQQKSYMEFLELKPGLDSEKAGTDCLSYGAAACVFNSQCHCGLKSNYSPGQRSFTFIVPLNIFMATQCAEASTEGLIFSITHGRNWMPSMDYFSYVCKRFPCCCLDICLHRTTDLQDVLSSFE
jgi:hypothetical protein